MNAQRGYARFAGVMYLVVLILDIAGAVVLSAISGAGSFVDVAHRIAASEALYRLGLCLSLGGSLATVLLAVGLYVTVKPYDGNLAMTALLFRTAEAAIGGMGIALGFVTLQVHLAASHPGALDADQLGAFADVLSKGDATTQVSAIFFTFGSTVFFYLFFKSGYIPRLIAGLGILASIVYAAAWFFSLVLPQDAGIPLAVGSVPILVAEVSTGLWLLIRGVKLQEVHS